MRLNRISYAILTGAALTAFPRFVAAADQVFNDTDIEASGKASEGILVSGGSTFTATSTDGNTLTANNNGIRGIMLTDANSTFTSTNMNIMLDGNTYAGLALYNNAVADITGGAGGHTLTSTGSPTGAGIGIWDTGGSLTITNMNLDLRNNYDGGLGMTKTGYISITGGSDGNQMLLSGGSYGVGVWNYTPNGLPVIDISNMNITGNNTISAITAAGKANINITGGSDGHTMMFHDNSKGGVIVYTGATVNIRDMDITASRNRYGVGASGSGGSLTITGGSNGSSMTLNNNSDAGIFIDAGATVTIDDMNITGEGNLMVGMSGDSTFNLTDSSLVSKDSPVFASVVSGMAEYDLRNSAVISKSGELLYTDTGTAGSLSADNSSLEGAVVSYGTTSLDFANGSYWKMRNSSNANTLSLADSVIDMRSNTPGAFNTLTVGTLNGTGSTILMNTYLGGDASPTDRIIVTGEASGSTTLRIFQSGGTGSSTLSNGIKLVDAQGGAITASDAFALYGGQVDTSGYVYKLYKGGADGSDSESWYLRSTQNLTDIARTIGNEPSIILHLTHAGMNTLSKRMGELRFDPSDTQEGAWIRTHFKDMHVNDFIDTYAFLAGIEGGYDRKLHIDAPGRYYAGIMAGYISLNDIKSYQSNGRTGTGSGTAPSFGIYGTWLGSNGWFADATLRTFFEDWNFTSYAANNQRISYDLDRQMTAASFETGRKFDFDIDPWTKWFILPKFEAIYAFAGAKSFYTSIGTQLHYGQTESLVNKLSIDIGLEGRCANCSIVQPYLHAAIIQEWDGVTNIRYDNASYRSELDGTSFEFGAGMNAKIGDDTSVYGEIMYDKGQKIKSLSGNIGFRKNW